MSDDFWSDHRVDMANPQYRKAFAAASRRVRVVDSLANGHVWDVFIAVVSGAFGYIEYQAIKNGTPTLSQWLRRQIGVYPANHNRQILRVWFGASLAWLAVHILRGGSDAAARDVGPR